MELYLIVATCSQIVSFSSLLPHAVLVYFIVFARWKEPSLRRYIQILLLPRWRDNV